MRHLLWVLLLLGAAAPESEAQPRPGRARPAPATDFFTTSLSRQEMAGKQLVLDSTRGQIVIDLLPDKAPNHIGFIIREAKGGRLDGTLIHRVIPHGIIQGGDPLTKDAGKAEQYGTGGLGRLRAEISDERLTRGAVAAALRPNERDSGGSQFFIVLADQPQLDGQFTVWGRVSEGLPVAQQISTVAADERQRPTERIEITRASVRDAPPPAPVPFADVSDAELANYRAVLETSLGEIAVEFAPDEAPTHVRNFLRLAALGAYDGTSFHRVVPGFVVQGGSMDTRTTPLPQRVQQHVGTLAPEFNDLPHVKGTLSMARGADPASASTSFFLTTGPAPSLDGRYTAFGRVVNGLDVLEKIETVPREGEKPVERVELERVRIEKKSQQF